MTRRFRRAQTAPARSLAIPADGSTTLNALLLDPDTPDRQRPARAWSPATARRRRSTGRPARPARCPALLDRVRADPPGLPRAISSGSSEQRDRGAFVSVADYRRGVLGDRADTMAFRDDMAVTLEVSALQYFPWVIAAARSRRSPSRTLMPGPLDPGPQDEGAGGRRRPAGDRGGDADHRRELRRDAGHQGHGRLEHPPGRPGDDHRLLRRRSASPTTIPCSGSTSSSTTTPTYGVRQVLNINPGTVLVGLPAAPPGRRHRVQDLGLHGQRQPVRRAVDPDRRQALRPRRRHDAARRLQLEQLGRTTRPWRSRAQFRRALGLRGRRPLRAPHHRDLEEHRAPAVRPARGAASSSPTTCRTSRPSTRAATRRSTPRGPTRRTSWTTSATRRRSSRAATGTHLQHNFMDKLDATNHTARALTEHGLSFVAARHLHR